MIVNENYTCSPCGKYLYEMERIYEDDPEKKHVLWILLHPTTYDVDWDDPTVRRLARVSESLGFVKIAVVFLFSRRAGNSDALKKKDDPVGLDNDYYLSEWIKKAGTVVLAWGMNGNYMHRDRRALYLCRKYWVQPYCVGLTKHGHPISPRYVRDDARLQLYTEI